jgi:hypothetical protein
MEFVMQMPQWSNYGNYTSDNYGAHTLRFDIGPYTFWYSYKTLVAFHAPGHPRVVCENVWTPTTGKHLNMIDKGDKKSRVDEQTFKRLVKELLEPHFKDVA